MTSNNKYVVRFTNAPIDYDGFGTIRTGVEIYDRFARELFEVKILDEHLDWQEYRYGSGLYVSLEETLLMLI